MNSPVDPTRCPLCGELNECLLAAGAVSNERCWCAAKRFPRELLARVPECAWHRACICQRCWAEAIARQRRPSGPGPEAVRTPYR